MGHHRKVVGYEAGGKKNDTFANSNHNDVTASHGWEPIRQNWSCSGRYRILSFPCQSKKKKKRCVWQSSYVLKEAHANLHSPQLLYDGESCMVGGNWQKPNSADFGERGTLHSLSTRLFKPIFQKKEPATLFIRKKTH